MRRGSVSLSSRRSKVGYRFLEHTADIRAECQAASFPELLETAAQALYAVALRETRTDAHVEHEVAIQAESPEEMLVRWLQELIFLMDVEHFVATRFDLHHAAEDRVAATLRGYEYQPEERATEIKAATYHGMAVRHTNEGIVAEVIFDL